MRVRDIVISEDWSPKVGGAHYWLENVYKRWTSRVPVFTATRAHSTNFAEKVDEEGMLIVNRSLRSIESISIKPRDWISVFYNIKQIRQKLSGNGVRLHCKAYFPEGMVGYLVKRSSRKVERLIVYAHGEEINVARTSGILGIIAKMVYSFADTVIVNSKNTEALVKSVCPHAKTIVIHPGVDARRIGEAVNFRSETRKRYGWLETEFVVLTIARLEPRKNVVAVIEALSALRREGKYIRYLIIGTGESRDIIFKSININDASEWVRVIDRVTEDEKFALFGAADLFAMPSVRHGQMVEGFGIVFIEAAAAGLPSISGNDGGQKEAVIDEVTGLNVDGHSVDSIKSCVAKIIDAWGVTSKYSKSAQEWAKKNDWSEVSRKVRFIADPQFESERG